jgi:Zn-dependent M32 family carboxypeptidase
VHPFEVSQATDDVRITTRFDESFISMAIFGAENTSFCAIYILNNDHFTKTGS